MIFFIVFLKEVIVGDCIVCFSKRTIYKVCIELEKLGYNVVVIYGSLFLGRLILRKLFYFSI